MYFRSYGTAAGLSRARTRSSPASCPTWDSSWSPRPRCWTPTPRPGPRPSCRSRCRGCVSRGTSWSSCAGWQKRTERPRGRPCSGGAGERIYDVLNNFRQNKWLLDPNRERNSISHSHSTGVFSLLLAIPQSGPIFTSYTKFHSFILSNVIISESNLFVPVFIPRSTGLPIERSQVSRDGKVLFPRK